jgi:hypothetical protein
MTPTAKLRFVLRDEQTGMYGSIPVIKTVRILQQWWESPNIMETSRQTDEKGQPYISYKYKGEWRDVPVEKEDFTQNKTSG